MTIKYSLREPMAPGNTLMEKFQTLKELGFSGIEITNSSTADFADEIKAASDATGIVPNICSARGGNRLLDARPEERRTAVKSINDALTLCAEVGGVGVIFPPLIGIKMGGGQRIPDLSPLYSTSALEKDLLIEILKRDIAPHAEACDSLLIIEPLNRYEQWWPCTVAQGVEICEAVGSPSIATMADLFHMSIEEADLADAIRAGDKHIANVHLADSNRILPGYGHTDFGPPLKSLSDIGYDYYCGFECSIPPGDARAELRKSMDYLNRQFAVQAQSFDPSKYLMRMVPCGNSLEINKKYGVYFCPSDRRYSKRHRFLGLYKDKAVRAILEIDSIFDIKYDGVNLKKTLMEGRDTDEYDNKIIESLKDTKALLGWDNAPGQLYFCGALNETQYVKSSRGGMQSTRYENLRKVIGDDIDQLNVAEIAQKLWGKQWE